MKAPKKIVNQKEKTLAEIIENRIPTTQQEGIRYLLCATLKHAYDKTEAEILDVELDIPGSDPRPSRPSKPGEIPIPQQDPGVEYEVRVTYYRNPHKQDLLKKALAMGCAWAIEEKEKLG